MGLEGNGGAFTDVVSIVRYHHDIVYATMGDMAISRRDRTSYTRLYEKGCTTNLCYVDNTFDTVRYGRLGVDPTEDHRYGREEQQEARRQGRRHPRLVRGSYRYSISAHFRTTMRNSVAHHSR